MVVKILFAMMLCGWLFLLICLVFFEGPDGEENLESAIRRIYEENITLANERAEIYQNAYEELCQKYTELLDKYEELYKEKGE